MPVCADQITTEVTMGNLSMSRSDPCQEESEPTPAFDEIMSLLAPALQGNFDGPVDSTEPRLFPMRWSASGCMINLRTRSRSMPPGAP